PAPGCAGRAGSEGRGACAGHCIAAPAARPVCFAPTAVLGAMMNSRRDFLKMAAMAGAAGLGVQDVLAAPGAGAGAGGGGKGPGKRLLILGGTVFVGRAL